MNAQALCLGWRGFLKKPGTVHVVIGPTIDPRGRKAEEIIKQTE